MKVLSIRHKGVKRLYLQDDGKDLPAEYVEKIAAMLSFICAMEDEAELKSIPSWKAHQLKGNRIRSDNCCQKRKGKGIECGSAVGLHIHCDPDNKPDAMGEDKPHRAGLNCNGIADPRGTDR